MRRDVRARGHCFAARRGERFAFCELILSEWAEGKTRFERQVTSSRVPSVRLPLPR